MHLPPQYVKKWADVGAVMSGRGCGGQESRAGRGWDGGWRRGGGWRDGEGRKEGGRQKDKLRTLCVQDRVLVSLEWLPGCLVWREQEVAGN
ncbi:hypothetical protein E2C01_068371 [Portunus trituberculatus]|uniref:Uncharacterized protein n=1 Tax=Portunus trituberculatus TaxID=210409 RepID=A0A5B7HWA9_PORTR|nr:hypothetical protein [Portunus trituberculatus]